MAEYALLCHSICIDRLEYPLNLTIFTLKNCDQPRECPADSNKSYTSLYTYAYRNVRIYSLKLGTG